MALSASDAQKAQELLWADRRKRLRTERAQELEQHQVTYTRPNGTSITMKYAAKEYHPTLRSKTTNTANTVPMPLFIGLHGGGGCPASVNDQQWENHQRLYRKELQGVANAEHHPLLYITPRAPTNTWNLWHEPHMDHLLDGSIENLLASNSSTNDHNTAPRIDSNRVYIMGYSAGGDGVLVG